MIEMSDSIQDYSFTRLKAIVQKNVNNVNTFQ
jgi:hypothetical protein